MHINGKSYSGIHLADSRQEVKYNDPKAKIRRVQALFKEERSEDRKAKESRHV